jgi:hypothetical protein
VNQQIPAAGIPAARVATRPAPGGLAERRRRLYQRHLIVFLGACAGLVALDVVTSPGVQWAHFLATPWLLVFVFHTLGLKSRGYTLGELFTPPRAAPVKDVYTVPLDYELVRSRQLRDGVSNVVNAVRAKDAALADDALAAVDELIGAMEGLVSASRGEKYRAAERAQKLVPEARAAVTALDELHQGLLRVVLEQAAGDAVPLQAVRERAAALRGLAK